MSKIVQLKDQEGDSLYPNVRLSYGALFNPARETLYNINSWTNFQIPFTHFWSNNENDFEKNGNLLKCKFNGTVLIFRQITHDFTGELDIVDSWSWWTSIGTRQAPAMQIKNVSINDNIDFTCSGGVSGTLVVYGARLVVLRIA